MFVIFLRRCVWKGLYLCRLRLSVMRLDMVNGIYCCNNQQTVRGLSVAAFQRQVLFKCTYSTHALVLSHRLIMDSFLDMRCCLLVYYWIFLKCILRSFFLTYNRLPQEHFFISGSNKELLKVPQLEQHYFGTLWYLLTTIEEHHIQLNCTFYLMKPVFFFFFSPLT